MCMRMVMITNRKKMAASMLSEKKSILPHSLSLSLSHLSPVPAGWRTYTVRRFGNQLSAVAAMTLEAASTTEELAPPPPSSTTPDPSTFWRVRGEHLVCHRRREATTLSRYLLYAGTTTASLGFSSTCFAVVVTHDHLLPNRACSSSSSHQSE